MKNLARLLALCDRDNLKVIAVKNKTANVTNGHVLIRRYLDVPNGFYWPGAHGDVVTAPLPESYPDTEKLKPNFDRLQLLGIIDKNVIAEMLKACVEAIEMGKDLIFTNDGLLCNDMRLCPLPLKNLPTKIVINPVYLDIVLKEMLNYCSAKVLVEACPDKPMIIGEHWDRCGVIMPMRGDTDG